MILGFLDEMFHHLRWENYFSGWGYLFLNEHLSRDVFLGQEKEAVTFEEYPIYKLSDQGKFCRLGQKKTTGVNFLKKFHKPEGLAHYLVGIALDLDFPYNVPLYIPPSTVSITPVI
ncbi:MAG: hypothetical protein MAG431_02353 [Chloroflexi bacterium]|nr:hypothetical protein [Chloroflexota bacterium]